MSGYHMLLFNMLLWLQNVKEGQFDAIIDYFNDGDRSSCGRVLKIFSQLIICSISIVASLALSDSLGLTSYDNGLVAITMSSVSLILACWKLCFVGADWNKASELNKVCHMI